MNLEDEVKFLRDRERSICEAVGGVSDGGQYRNDVIDHLKAIYAFVKEVAEDECSCSKDCGSRNSTHYIIGHVVKEKGRSLRTKDVCCKECLAAKAKALLGSRPTGT